MVDGLDEAVKINGLDIKDRSKLNINNISISNTRNAVISQDSSVIDVKNITINNCKNIFAALQTKSDYGPSIITVADFEDSNVNSVYLIEDEWYNNNKQAFACDVTKVMHQLRMLIT